MLSRRSFLRGLVAGPAILKLGLYMPIKAALTTGPELLVPAWSYLTPAEIQADIEALFASIARQMQVPVHYLRGVPYEPYVSPSWETSELGGMSPGAR
jgi:hypothetical protein